MGTHEPIVVDYPQELSDFRFLEDIVKPLILTHYSEKQCKKNYEELRIWMKEYSDYVFPKFHRDKSYVWNIKEIQDGLWQFIQFDLYKNVEQQYSKFIKDKRSKYHDWKSIKYTDGIREWHLMQLYGMREHEIEDLPMEHATYQVDMTDDGRGGRKNVRIYHPADIIVGKSEIVIRNKLRYHTIPARRS